ncbi:MAG: VOC family protein [Candidatus Aenigmarchaeota archaeon]|nr:VOC family protein [Candidatus Aenigmarchaeota archaeon]
MNPVNHIKIRVNNFRNAKDFYSSLFGFLGWTKIHEEYNVIGFRKGDVSFWLQEADRELKCEHTLGETGYDHIAFNVESRERVDMLHKFLQKEQVKILIPPKKYPKYQKGYYAIFFADPDGLKLEAVFLPKWRKE